MEEQVTIKGIALKKKEFDISLSKKGTKGSNIYSQKYLSGLSFLLNQESWELRIEFIAPYFVIKNLSLSLKFLT